jgi:pyruvate dehydrogenase E2 component (dihydrolipoamide acetyltransferase)
MAIEFRLPDLGEDTEGGDIVNVLVAEGDTIESEQHVLEIETDKAVVELPCPHAGRIAKLHVKEGDHVKVGELVLTIDTDGQAVTDTEADRDESERETETPAENDAESVDASDGKVLSRDGGKESSRDTHTLIEESTGGQTAARDEKRSDDTEKNIIPAGPATRRLARVLGVDLASVQGSARGGRVTQEDVQAFVRQAMSSQAVLGEDTTTDRTPPLPDFEKWGPIEHQPLSGVRRKTASTMSRAWRAVPQVTQFDSADITLLEEGRRRFMKQHPDAPAKITVTVLVVKAVTMVLKTFPTVNASYDPREQELILKRYYHIGVAVDTDHGLLVPVIRDTDAKSVARLASELESLADQARNRKLTLEQMQGGTFTISNLGGIGGTGFSPIVYHPEVAILGMARSRTEAVFRDGSFQPRLMLPLSLTYDHRVIHGADGARFLRKVAQLLSDPLEMLIEA